MSSHDSPKAPPSGAADHSNRHPWRFVRRTSAWATAGTLAGGLYLLLIDTTSLPELIVLAGAAVIAATGFELAREQETAGGVSVRLRWLAALYRPLLKAPSDIAVVSLIALRQLIRPRRVNGTFRAVPFRAGEGHDIEIGRRALAESFGSFAPNTIIIGIDEEHELILGHQLRPSGGAEAIDLLRLGSE
jgi:hypothetical protein